MCNIKIVRTLWINITSKYALIMSITSWQKTTIQKTQSTHHYDGTSRIVIYGRFEYKIYKIRGNIQEFSSVGELILSQNLSSDKVFFFQNPKF
jgi:hypothetical protein